jgi:hypothetical protein
MARNELAGDPQRRERTSGFPVMTVLARAASVLAFVCLASSSSVAQALVLASRAPDGTPGDSISQHPAISADGRWVVFVSSASNLVVGDDNGREDLFRFDRLTGCCRSR